MKNMRLLKIGLLALIGCFQASMSVAQTEVMAWSNITGVRVDGELIDFESTLRVGDLDGNMEITGKEKQVRPRYHRDGNSQEVITSMRKVQFTQKVVDLAKERVGIHIDMASDTTLNQAAYFCLAFPDEHYAAAKIKRSGRKIAVTAPTRKLELKFERSVKSFVKMEDGNQVVYIQLASSLKKGDRNSIGMELYATGVIDHSDANIAVDVQKPGSLFVGFGGNFRMQNPSADPKVVDYCLNNLRVAYGRVEFPWSAWHPEEDMDPIENILKNGETDRLKRSIDMAIRLKQIGMPVILSTWFPPRWAVEGDFDKPRGNIAAHRLNQAKKEKIFKSMADYLVYMKKYHGVEFVMFSFNESDLGIDVLFTPQEHADFIKEFGAYLAKLNLPTKMLLGDNSDATTFDFILPALNDPACLPYIGAVSFHSWRGCDDATLVKWRDAARQINVPLLVGEGSTDAAAHMYSEIFNESTFALYEINLYTRICAICQPLSILQWQLTSDYSLLWGDGIYRSTGPLRPTQRFWNIKQLASTPSDALALAFTNDNKHVNAAAFGNIARGEYAVHMVNNGADRHAVISGLPDGVKSVKVFVTNTQDCMKESKAEVTDGTVKVYLPAISFVTVISEK